MNVTNEEEIKCIVILSSSENENWDKARYLEDKQLNYINKYAKKHNLVPMKPAPPVTVIVLSPMSVLPTRFQITGAHQQFNQIERRRSTLLARGHLDRAFEEAAASDNGYSQRMREAAFVRDEAYPLLELAQGIERPFLQGVGRAHLDEEVIPVELFASGEPICACRLGVGLSEGPQLDIAERECQVLVAGAVIAFPQERQVLHGEV